MVAMLTMLIAGLFACFVGVVWIGQGIGLIEGSGMTDEIVWAILGALLVAAGVGLFVSAARMRRLRRTHAGSDE